MDRLKSSPWLSDPFCCHYGLFCDQVPFIMWDPDDARASFAGCRHARARRRVACPQLLQPHWFLIQEERILRETHHWVGASSLLALTVFLSHDIFFVFTCEINLFLIPWWFMQHEFRIFVFNQLKVTNNVSKDNKIYFVIRGKVC